MQRFPIRQKQGITWVAYVFFSLTFLVVVSITLPEWKEFIGVEYSQLYELAETETGEEKESEENNEEPDSEDDIQNNYSNLSLNLPVNPVYLNPAPFYSIIHSDIHTPPPELV